MRVIILTHQFDMSVYDVHCPLGIIHLIYNLDNNSLTII